jgi:thiosulfate reductase cytochrome b subunit
VNAILCLLLIISGVSMQYSNPEYPFIRFDIAVTMHNVAGVIITLSYAWFIIGNIRTDNGRFYKMKLRGLKYRLTEQTKYYAFGIFKGMHAPFPINKNRKFNPLQKLAYSFIMYVFFPLIFISGWALLFPEFIIHNVFGFSGIHLTGLLHIISGFIISVFMFVHIYFCTIGTTVKSNFSAMLTGWHE